MNYQLSECFDLLGLSPGASPAELKLAHRDLAKVWHPDRFLHDPRLQEKAQEKLKKINEAYDQLRSGKAERQSHPPAPASERQRPPTPEHFDQQAQTNAQTVSVAKTPRIRWQLILAPVLVFAVAFLGSRLLLRSNEQKDQRQVPAIEQAQAPVNPERQQPGSRVNTSASELPRGKDPVEVKSQREESGSASTSEPSAASLRPLPTVTIVIDPSTGMIARADCPTKTRMTYPSGNEPQQYCNAVHAAAPADTSGSKDSRLKSVAKRLASPGKWFGDKAKPDDGKKQDSKAP